MITLSKLITKIRRKIGINTTVQVYHPFEENFDHKQYVIVGDYNTISLVKTNSSYRGLIWWTIKSTVDDNSYMVLRDQDFYDLKNLFKHLESKEYKKKIFKIISDLKHM